MAEQVKSGLNLGLVLITAGLCVATFSAIILLRFINPQDEVLPNAIMQIATPVLIALVAWLTHDTHRAVNSTVDKAIESVSRESVLVGREQMRGEMEQMRASLQETLRAAARQIVDEAAEANKRNVLELSAAAKKLALDTAEAAVQLAIANRKTAADARKEADVLEPQPEQEEEPAEFAVTSDVPVTIVEKK